MNNTTSYSGYNITLPEFDKPYWIMWGYRGRDNQRAYSPAICLMDFSPALIKVFNVRLLITSGNAQYGTLSNSLAASDLVYPDTFSIKAGLTYKWDRGNSPIGWYLVDGKRVGASNRPNKDIGTARDMYANGYLGRTGDMSAVYSQELMTAFGSAVIQGRTVDTTQMKWSAYVPTLEEFKTKIGAIFQTGIPTTAPLISALTMEENMWYLTSTESTTSLGKLQAINSKGEITDVLPDTNVRIQLLFEGELL